MANPENKRFAVEEIENGYLIKITEMGNDKLVGRYAFPNADALIAFLDKTLLASKP